MSRIKEFPLPDLGEGLTEGEILKVMKQHFATVRHVKPSASREDSAELFVLALGFKG